MASEIRVDKINSLSGVGTVTLSPTGVEIAGITTVGILTSTGAINSGAGFKGNRLNIVSETPRIYLTDTNNNDDYQVRNENGTFEVRNDTDGVNVFTIEKGPANTATFSSTTKVGTGITLSPDGDIFTTGITTFTDDVQFIGDSGISSITYDKSENQLNFVDNAQARFGTGADLKIFHTGDHSLIRDDGTGSLLIQGSQIAIQNPSGSETMAQFIQDNAVVLYHDNVMRLTVTGAGISVSQTSGGFSEFRHGGGDSGVRIAGPAGSSGANLVFANNHNNTLDDRWTIQLHGATDDLLIKAGGVSGTEKVRFLDTGGITFNGDTANANALDDYEEGDWTPKQTDGGTNYTISHAKYVKIGRLVHLTFDITSSSATNLTQIWNLPFTPADYSSWSTAYYAVNANTTGTGTAGYSNTRHGGLVVPSGGGYLHTRILGGTVTWTITNTDRLIGSATYRTTAQTVCKSLN